MQTIAHKVNRIALSVFRSIVVLVITLPLMLGFAYSLIQLWAVWYAASYLFYAGIFMWGVMFVQILALVLQEWTVLHNKEFYE